MYHNTQSLLNALRALVIHPGTSPDAEKIAAQALFDFNDNLAQQIRREITAKGGVSSTKIFAIKLYREHTGGSLTDAKDWVENHMATDV